MPTSAAQKLKYHCQTSGRSLHAQEIQFNDIRTTLQALIATYDNANSLHTNAFDEAITTPTEDSVRRAMAIQMIINREWGLAKNENPNQGSFIIDELTELVEEAVLKEFESISERGGVLGAMELGYQRGKIQEESLHYEHLKHTGEYPIIGVNTFRNPHGETVPDHIELARSTEEEKQSQLKRLQDFQKRHAKEAPKMLKRLQQAVIRNENVFAVLMDAVRVCSLGQITNALFEVGGQYRQKHVAQTCTLSRRYKTSNRGEPWTALSQVGLTQTLRSPTRAAPLPTRLRFAPFRDVAYTKAGIMRDEGATRLHCKGAS